MATADSNFLNAEIRLHHIVDLANLAYECRCYRVCKICIRELYIFEKKFYFKKADLNKGLTVQIFTRILKEKKIEKISSQLLLILDAWKCDFYSLL